MKMKWFWMVALTLLASACSDGTDSAKAPAEMPGSVAPENDKGDWRTRFYTDFRGTLLVDDTVYDSYAPTGSSWYQGHELQLEAGDTLDVRVGALSAGFDAVIGVYGPQRPSGEWGALVASNDDSPEGGTFDSYIRLEVAKSGNYLVLVREYDWNAGDYFVAVGCVAGSCEALCQSALCDLYCPYGNQIDTDGCGVCQCNPEPSCQWVVPPPYVRCAGIETWAKNPADDTCCAYPSPCNVPDAWETFESEAACEGFAAEGEGCSMYGTQCADGLECEFQCPDGSNDANCNLGINPSGVCVAPVFGECQTDSDCMETGCSGQYCAPAPVISTCEWRVEYACYGEPTTSCGCNEGVCGWAQTPELQACLGGN